jgi:hypothetical protein
MKPGEVTHEVARTPSPADANADRRWVLGSLLALVAIAAFFVAIGRYEGTSGTTEQAAAPADSGTVGGASLMPKGPSSN